LGVGLITLPVKKKIVEKPPRNSAGFCGGGQGLSWAVEPRKERKNWPIRSLTSDIYILLTSKTTPRTDKLYRVRNNFS
jgi:hypothetical protein